MVEKSLGLSRTSRLEDGGPSCPEADLGAVIGDGSSQTGGHLPTGGDL